MPVDDGCLTERDAYQAQLEFAQNLCDLAIEAFEDWMDLIQEIADECAAELGPRPEVPEGAVPMLEHAIQELQEEYDQKLEQCLEGSSEIINTENLYFDLMAACEIENDAADALKDAYEACQHELKSGIPLD